MYKGFFCPETVSRNQIAYDRIRDEFSDRSGATMLIGYARVSTADQNLDLQHDALKRAGCTRLFEDKVSGSRADRPGLADALSHLRKSDTLVVWKLDRLGRTVRQLVEFVAALQGRGVEFKSVSDSID